MSCDNYPSKKDVEDFALNAKVINEFTTESGELTTSAASDGKNKITLAEIWRQANEKSVTEAFLYGHTWESWVVGDEAIAGRVYLYRWSGGHWTMLTAIKSSVMTATPDMLAFSFLNSPSVKDFGAVGDGVNDDSAAIQSAVNYAISSGLRRTYIDFSSGEVYVINNQVIIESNGFLLEGNAPALYRSTTASPALDSVGYITGNAANTDGCFFNYGNDRDDISSNNFKAKGLSFYTKERSTGDAIMISQANNGPHRGIQVHDCSASGLNALVGVKVSKPIETIAAATIECYNNIVIGCEYHVYCYSRVFMLHVHDNQSEQGARIGGFVDATISIHDNMLEGQSDPISIDSYAPQLDIRNNYFEGNTGEYLGKFSSTNSSACLTLGKNYISRLKAPDAFKITGTWCLNVPRSASTQERIVDVTAYGSLRLHHQLDMPAGLIYKEPDATISALLPISACMEQNPRSLDSVIAASLVALGSETLYTPAGKTTTGMIVTGFDAIYKTLNMSYNAGDTIVCAALVKLESTENPSFFTYNDTYQNTGIAASQFGTSDKARDGWFVMLTCDQSDVAGTAFRFRFGANGTNASAVTKMQVAAIGAYVIPESEVHSLGEDPQQRQLVRFFNPWFM